MIQVACNVIFILFFGFVKPVYFLVLINVSFFRLTWGQSFDLDLLSPEEWVQLSCQFGGRADGPLGGLIWSSVVHAARSSGYMVDGSHRGRWRLEWRNVGSKRQRLIPFWQMQNTIYIFNLEIKMAWVERARCCYFCATLFLNRSPIVTATTCLNGVHTAIFPKF